MERVLAAELSAHVGERVRMAGWLHHKRQLAKVTFLLLRDRSGIAQVVVTVNASREEIAGLLGETVVEVNGTVLANEQAPSGVELVDPAVRVLTKPADAPPFELRRPSLNAQLPTLLDRAALSLRHPARRALAQIAAASASGFRAALDRAGFTEIFTPKVVASATENGANVFPIDWFGRRAYLAQSPQFFKQIMVGVFERVYEVGPVFRAEPHDTARHLAEYLSLDAEMGFIHDHHDVMAILRDVLAAMIETIRDRGERALEVLNLELPEVPIEIPVVHFDDAQHMIEASTGRTTLGEPDLSPADERWLGEWAQAEHGSDFLFVAGYPMAKRPFYTHPDPTNPVASNSFDLLFRGLELVTGGQRLHRYQDYLDALGGEETVAFEGYLEAFRYGMPAHGGFAIGLERWVARLAGVSNVREGPCSPATYTASARRSEGSDSACRCLRRRARGFF